MYYFLANILLILLLIVLLRFSANRISYGILYYIYWWFFCGVGYALYQTQYDYYAVPFLWIFGSFCCVMTGQMIGEHIQIFNSGNNGIRYWKLRRQKIKNIIVTLLILNLIILIFSFVRNGQIGLLFSPGGILSILNSSESQRLAGEALGDGNAFGVVFGILYYFAIILYGFTYDIDIIKKSKILKVLCLINIVLSVIASAGKFSIISFIILFASGYLTTKIRQDKLGLKEIRYSRLAIYIFLAGTVLYFLMNNRAGYNVGISGLLSYGFGEIPSFNNWYINGPHETTYGVQSFYGIISHIAKGVHFAEGYSNYPSSTVYPIVNIFTAFRSSISDFGKFGGMIIYLIIGLAAGASQRRIKVSGFSNGVLTMLTGALLLSFLMPLGYYLSIFLAYLLFVAFLMKYFNGNETCESPNYYLTGKQHEKNEELLL